MLELTLPQLEQAMHWLEQDNSYPMPPELEFLERADWMQISLLLAVLREEREQQSIH
jgi:hypothetical protein